MLWEIEIRPIEGEIDREAARILAEARALGAGSITRVQAARSFLIEGELDESAVNSHAVPLLADRVVETALTRRLPAQNSGGDDSTLLNVLLKPGVTDNVGQTAAAALRDLGLSVGRVATCRKYEINRDAADADIARLSAKVLSNDAIEQVLRGPLQLTNLSLGGKYTFQLVRVPIREMSAAELDQLSREGQLYLSLVEMQTIQSHFRDLGREPTDIELETIAQTWSEHCSHKTLAGRIRYRDEHGERQFTNMLKETIFAATQEIRRRLGPDDWCVSVFRDNAGVVRFDDKHDVCIKVETHNHPSALEPYGGANTGLGGVIRDPLGTGLGAKPVCNTDVFCFAPPDTPYDALPPGVLHPRAVMHGVVSGVRDYGNRMGIPTVNGAVYFDERYVGNPLVYCGNVALMPVGKSEKRVIPGDYIVAVGGRTGRDGIHGATFSSAELTHESESVSGGAVQIGNAVTEKMLMDVILAARDRGLYHAITDCGAGGFSSAVGEMGSDTGAEVWLEKPPLKYAGLSYTEIWISEAQERMVLAVPPASCEEFHALCVSEGVEATIIGKYTDTRRLVLKYEGHEVGNVDMHFLHDGRPPVVREAVFEPRERTTGPSSTKRRSDGEMRSAGDAERFAVSPSAHPPISASAAVTEPASNGALKAILGSLNVCSKEWIIRQYDHEVQAGSVVKPLVGVTSDGPSDAAVVRPDLRSRRGLVIACGMNPRYGDIDPYWMAASAIDEAVRNCVALGADPKRIAILDNFCWGNTDRPETLGSLVRAALGCHDTALAYGTPFVSGKDSLNNEFTYVDETGRKRTIAIPPSLLITALGQIDDIEQAVTMDLKEPGNVLYLVGDTKEELGGSHYAMIHSIDGGRIPHVDPTRAPALFTQVHAAIRLGCVKSCHDLSEGGLAAALAEVCFAGGLGAEIDLAMLAAKSGINDPSVLLFSESNTRFLIEVAASDVTSFEVMMNPPDRDSRAVRLGIVNNSAKLVIRRKAKAECVVDATIEELKTVWQQPLAQG
jgi:phosphoribosylformylglycinamidine synthase